MLCSDQAYLSDENFADVMITWILSLSQILLAHRQMCIAFSEEYNSRDDLD